MVKYDILMRCKNEILDLPTVAQSIEAQNVAPQTVVFVDSGSTDGSREFAAQSGYNVVDYVASNFNYSVSLNLGMRHCTSDFVLILSAHCILYDEDAVENLLKNALMPQVAGVFGRQIPTKNSTPIDVRDLLTVFGRERIVYEKHPFFHNAFSLVNHGLWEQIPFDESLNGIEDRVWAREACDRGWKIVYEPDAVALHEHGLNQSASQSRALRVCRALSTLHKNDIIEFPENITSVD